LVKIVALNENIFYSETIIPLPPSPDSYREGDKLFRFVKAITFKFLFLLTMVYCLLSIDCQAKDIFQTGLEQFEAKQFQEAAISFSAYLEKNPDDVTALYNRGLCYYESNDINNAIADFSKVLTINNSNVVAKEKLSNALIRRATTAYENDDLENALADFDAYLLLNPDDDVVLFNKGIIYSKTERKKEAVDEFTKAITKNAKTGYFLNRALDYFILKDLDKCLSDLNDVLKTTPNDTTALWLRASINYEKDNYEAAKKDLEKLILLKPDNRAVKDLYFTTSFSYYIEKNKYWALALVALLIAAIFFSIKALMKRS
jgi:tetratricopeptide (TPR) repeat protein